MVGRCETLLEPHAGTHPLSIRLRSSSRDSTDDDHDGPAVSLTVSMLSRRLTNSISRPDLSSSGTSRKRFTDLAILKSSRFSGAIALGTFACDTRGN